MKFGAEDQGTKELLGDIIPSIFLLLLILGIIGYAFTLYGQNGQLDADLGAAKVAINDLETKLASTTAERDQLNVQLTGKVSEAAAATERANQIFSAVSVLKKLNETDKELLEKYSKVYFLNEHYIPASLSTIDSNFVFEKGRTLQIHAQVAPFLTDLINRARADGVDLSVLSAYRSFGTQTSLKSNYKVTYGAGTANKFSADQGYSEHQLGTTVDFTNVKVGGVLTGFEKTPSYTWLLAHAHEYGFILSYPKSNTYYTFEPWHWRFVGVKLATSIHNQSQNFYDVDQRTIDQSLVNIFDR